MRTSKLICTDLKWVCESFFCVFKYMLPGKSLAQTAWNAGQERVLWEKQRFVRNRHFSNGPFTGKFPVFQFCPLRLRCFSEDNRVEYFSDFSGFCSTFGSACPKFGGSGRQKSSTSPIFCLLSPPSAKTWLRAKLWFPGSVRKWLQCPLLMHELFSIVSAIRKSGSRIRKDPHDIGNHAGIWVDIIVW